MFLRKHPLLVDSRRINTVDWSGGEVVTNKGTGVPTSRYAEAGYRS